MRPNSKTQHWLATFQQPATQHWIANHENQLPAKVSIRRSFHRWKAPCKASRCSSRWSFRHSCSRRHGGGDPWKWPFWWMMILRIPPCNKVMMINDDQWPSTVDHALQWWFLKHQCQKCYLHNLFGCSFQHRFVRSGLGWVSASAKGALEPSSVDWQPIFTLFHPQESETIVITNHY